ncbi:MAG: serine/threonine-protein kinase [Deltaproteobacteria bacterium]|nr:serine/threonine-protein kinase [Deltaproteobacteria bacterium]
MKACPKCGCRYPGNEEFCPKDGTTLQEMDKPTDDPLVGATIDGRYKVEKKLGEGGMGVVYLATHAIIGKKCALKVLRGELSGEKEVAERFTQEARAAAAIGNEHIIEITDFGTLGDGSAYFVMEFLDGKPLHDVIEENPQMDPARVLRIVAQCCDALDAAHSATIVHRDLKPDNIFLIKRSSDQDFVKILDFGIAKMARETGRLTRTGMIFGTPQYMSPEQAAGTAMDGRTDIYSMGIIMYELLCGHVPFEADTFMGVLTKHLYEEPIPPRRLLPPVDVPSNVEAVLLKAIAKKPERRYQSMKDFGEDIRSIIDGKTPAIVFDKMRETATTTVPPPPPSAIVGGSSRRQSRDEPRARSRWPLFAGLGAIPVVGGIVAAVLLLGGGKDGQGAAATPKPVPVAVNPASTPVAPAPAPAPVAPAPAAVEHITITSDPPGASLFKSGALMGPLPFAIIKPASGATDVYTVKLDGYKDMDVVVAETTPQDFKVALERRPTGGGGKHKEPAASKGALQISPAADLTTVKVPGKKKRLGGDIVDPFAN